MACDPDVTMTATWRPTNSAARPGRRSRVPLRIAALDGEVLAFYIATLVQPVPERLQEMVRQGRRSVPEEPDPVDGVGRWRRGGERRHTEAQHQSSEEHGGLHRLTSSARYHIPPGVLVTVLGLV